MNSFKDLLNEVSDIIYELEIDSNPDLWLGITISDYDESIIITTSGLLKFNQLLKESIGDVKSTVVNLHTYLYEILRLKINNQWFNNGKFNLK